MDPVNPMNVYVTVTSGLLWSEDGGDTWNRPKTFAPGGCELEIHPTNPSTLYLAGLDVFRSTNRGQDWAGSVSGLPVNLANFLALAVDPSDGETLYLGIDRDPGIYKSTDGGANWGEVTDGLELTAVASLVISPSNPSILYAGGPGGKIQKSIDGADTWLNLDTGISEFFTVMALAVDPTDSSVVYAGTDGNGVNRSLDGGASWAEFNTGLPHVTILTLEIHPDDPQRVYAGLQHHSAFRYESGGVPPQYLFAAGDPAGLGGLFSGVAVSNFSGSDAGVNLAINDSTSGKAGLRDGGDLQPAGQQVDLGPCSRATVRRFAQQSFPGKSRPSGLDRADQRQCGHRQFLSVRFRDPDPAGRRSGD